MERVRQLARPDKTQRDALRDLWGSSSISSEEGQEEERESDDEQSQVCVDGEDGAEGEFSEGEDPSSEQMAESDADANGGGTGTGGVKQDGGTEWEKMSKRQREQHKRMKKKQREKMRRKRQKERILAHPDGSRILEEFLALEDS